MSGLWGIHPAAAAAGAAAVGAGVTHAYHSSGASRPRRRSNQATFVVERGRDKSARAKRLVSSDAADAEDSPAWTLSPSPERTEGEGEYSAYSPREKSATSPKRELVPPRGSPLRSPVSRSPLSFDLNRSPVLAAEPFPRLGAGSYQARRDARKASRRGDDPFDAGGTARTGLDVRGDTSGAAVFY